MRLTFTPSNESLLWIGARFFHHLIISPIILAVLNHVFCETLSNLKPIAVSHHQLYLHRPKEQWFRTQVLRLRGGRNCTTQQSRISRSSRQSRVISADDEHEQEPQLFAQTNEASLDSNVTGDDTAELLGGSESSEEIIIRVRRLAQSGPSQPLTTTSSSNLESEGIIHAKT